MISVLVDPVHSELGFKVLRIGNFPEIRIDYKKFPDGETYVRLKSTINGKRIAYITTGYPQQDESIIRTLFITKTLKELGAKEVIVVYAYFPYARQDKRFLEGEAISARIVAEAIINAGADELITIDVHAEEVYEGLPFKNITTEEIWAEFVKKYEEPFLIAPDKGRMDFIKRIAERAGLREDYIAFQKKRDLVTGKIVGHEPIDKEKFMELLRNKKTAVLIDDIISTGGTAASVIKELRGKFKGKIVAGFTHGLFLPGSIEKLLEAGADEIIATDTVKNNFSSISVAKLIADYLRRR